MNLHRSLLEKGTRRENISLSSLSTKKGKVKCHSKKNNNFILFSQYSYQPALPIAVSTYSSISLHMFYDRFVTADAVMLLKMRIT